MKTMIHKWPRINPKRNKGGSTSFIVDLGKTESGKRDRHFFKSKGEAETFAELARAKRENDGVQPLLHFVKERFKIADVRNGAVFASLKKFYLAQNVVRRIVQRRGRNQDDALAPANGSCFRDRCSQLISACLP